MDTLAPPLSCTSTKMNLGRAETLDWIERVILPQQAALARLSFFACLPYPLLPAALERLAGSGVTAGAQNCWPEGGPVTGEVSAALLAEIGCRHVMLGHAERRRLFGEDDTLVARKTAATAAAGMVPLVCVGEQEPASAAAAASHVAHQARTALGSLPPQHPALVLYEPVWAIGGERGARPDHAAAVWEALRSELAATAVRLLYGGAVVPGTFTALRAAAGWDGVAVGRAAQDAAMLRDVAAEMLDHRPS